VKHIKIKYYGQYQQVERGFLQFNYILSKENAADRLTKRKDSVPFKVFRDNLIHMATNIFDIEPRASQPLILVLGSEL
jgi:hypothetical protein